MALKNNILVKIFCVSIIFFTKLAYSLISYIIGIVNSSQNFMAFILIILYNFGEERLINNRKRQFSKVPSNIGIVLTEEKFKNIKRKLLRIINWNILVGIKHFHIYDPFSILGNENIKIIKESICELYNSNYSMLIVTENGMYDCRTRELVDRDSVKCSNYHLILTILNFHNANRELISSVFEKFIVNTNTLVLPKPLNYFEGNSKIINSNFDYNNEFERFCTRKNMDCLPELVLFCGSEEICLYGYPFTLLENSEVIHSGKISSIDVIKYLKFLERYNKINKNYGK